MEHQRIEKSFVTWPAALFLALMIGGAGAVVLRMMYGLGATTNLSDDWPWGLWKGFNVLCLIALGAGGFTSAALVYIFGDERYHAFARPTALWALLCYCFAGASLAVDIGIPWRIVNPIYLWPEHSILFEVAWCVMLYICVLSLEVAPTVFERFGWSGLEEVWRKLVPLFAVVALTFFTYIMSHSYAWAAGSFFFFTAISFFLSRVRKKPSTPLLLIMFGVILSVLHQSSLGSLFLLMPDKLSHFWWSPRLPVNFLLSAIMTGFAMLIIERTVSSKVFKRPLPNELLSGLGRILMAFVWAYLVFRIADVLYELGAAGEFGGVDAAFSIDEKGGLFLAEIVAGLIVPALMLSSAGARENPQLRVAACSLIVIGVLFNRLNVTFLGMRLPGTYVPGPAEVIISIATVSAIILLFTIGAKLMPIYPKIEEGGGGKVASS